MPLPQLQLLGGLRLALNGDVRLPTKKAEALLAYLAVAGGEPQRRDKLATLFWGDRGEEQARHSLSQTVYSIRKAFAAVDLTPLVAEGETLAFDGSEIDVDIDRFERSVDDGTPESLRAAATLYRGDLLDGLSLREADFEDWLAAERHRLRELALAALGRLLAHETTAGATAAAIQVAGRMLSIDPAQENVHRDLMRLYARQGRWAAALTQYDVCARQLRRELDADPTAETRELRDEIAQRRTSQPAETGPTSVEEATATAARPLEDAEPERKNLTVLFADIKGSTELVDGLDPELALQRLDPALQTMIDAVNRFEGTVSHTRGDGIMALFGAPVAHEDHAVRACYAALAMQEAVNALSGGELAIRVGLHSGEVVVRPLGGGAGARYDAVGPVVHLASRVEESMESGRIGLTMATLERAEGFIEAEALGAMRLRGVREPVDLFELRGSTSARSRWEARAARGLTPFVGRQAELEKMNRALERASRGQGEVVALIGEPGMGKTRMAHEFVRAAENAGWAVLETGGAAHNRDATYLPVSDMLRSWVEVTESDSQADIVRKVQSRVSSLGIEMLSVLPPLFALLDLPVDDAEWQALGAPQRRRRTLDALIALLARLSQQQPLILVVEDLHWIDSETQGFLDALVDGIAAVPMLLLVTYRPEYAHDWASRSYFRLIRADPLEDDTAAELLRHLLGDSPDLAHARRFLFERTGGTPLFLEETVRALIETGVITGARGAFLPAKPLDQFEIPTSVQEVLAARIDRLAPDAKNLLQVASVIGKDVPLALLQPIANLDDEALHTALGQLQAAEFLQQTRLIPEPEYTFKHALTQEVAYASVLRERRRSLHTRTVDTIEARYADRLDEHVERLAHHALTAEDWTKAVTYCRDAGNKALRRAALRAAVVDFERALDALHHLPETDESIAQDIDLRFELRNALFVLGDHATTTEHLWRAEELARRIGDDDRIGWSLLHLGATYWRQGDYGDAETVILQARDIAEQVGDTELGYLAAYRLGQTYYGMGDFNAAATWLKRAIADMQTNHAERKFALGGLPFVFSCSVLISSIAELGNFDEIEAYETLGLTTAEDAQDHYSLYVLTRGLGHAYARQGRFDLAAKHLERATEIGDLYELYTLAPVILSALGYVYVVAGRQDEGFALLNRSIDPAVWERSVHYARPYFWFAEAALVAGRHDDAAEMTRRGLELAEAQQEREGEIWALRLQGDLVAETDPEQAERHYLAAIAGAATQGLRPHLAHGQLSLGELYATIGRHDEAVAALRATAALYQDLGMTYWLPRTESALNKLTG